MMRFSLFATLLFFFLIVNSAFITAQIDNTLYSNSSQISIKTIEVNVTLNKEKFSPGDRITIRGTAKIGENSSINGTVKIKIDKSYNVSLKNGQFLLDTSILDSIESGDHTISIEVKDDYGNLGSAKKQIYVLPLPTRLEIYLNNNSFIPNTPIEVSAVLKDQNDKPIDSVSIITIYDSRGAEIVRAIIHDETFSFDMPKDAQPGDWWVYAYSEPLRARRFFKVEESKKIETSINGSILTVQNVGNVPYRNSISINFLNNGSAVYETFGLNLAVGAKTKIELKGSGDYTLKVSSPESESYFGRISLTGGVVGAKVYGDNSQLIAASVVFASALIAFALAFRIKKGRYKNSHA